MLGGEAVGSVGSLTTPLAELDLESVGLHVGLHVLDGMVDAKRVEWPSLVRNPGFLDRAHCLSGQLQCVVKHRTLGDSGDQIPDGTPACGGCGLGEGECRRAEDQWSITSLSHHNRSKECATPITVSPKHCTICTRRQVHTHTHT
jgi:hypothetical protein